MRVLLAIGCNEYDHAPRLNGAETDAQRIFDTLIRGDVGEYDPTRSKLLLSPTLGDIREALRQTLFSNNLVDTFTFFFAGHGAVRAGSFYMWVRDTTDDSQSISALSLADLFRSISEAAPAQSNLIIDACESGGLIADLSSLLKSDVYGNAGTPGITLVATSAQNQYALESEIGGVGTNAILDCIQGRDFVQDNASTLDLVEIGRRISIRLRGADQNPVVWGLNLYGPPRFCKNPRYHADPARPLREVVQTWPTTSDSFLREHYDEIWRVYVSASDKWNSREFAATADLIFSPLVDSPELLAGFAARFGAAVLERTALSDDPFRSAQVSATLAVCLLPYAEHEKVRETVDVFLDSTGEALLAAGVHVTSNMSADRYALLAKRGGGLADLFYLPLRISRILGWLALSSYLFQAEDIRRARLDQLFSEVLRMTLRDYGNSVVAISDAQAPYWAATLARTHQLGLVNEAEQLTGLLFYSLISCQGALARCDLPPEKALDYLMTRRAQAFTQSADLIERPIETFTVLAKIALALQLEDVFDESLWKLDGLAFSAYLNDDFSKFGSAIMSGGDNLVWTIGHEFFRIAQLSQTWPQKSASPKNRQVAALAILSSLLYPDRVAWFCLGEHSPPAQT